MTERNWKSGPPPHIGWWNTLRGEVSDPPNPMTWRWWDGANWSYGSHAKTCAPSATASWQKNEGVVWSDYYPEGARVPRVDPSLPASGGIIACLNQALQPGSQDYWLRKAWELHHHGYLRAGSNGLAQVKLGDPFAGISTMDLLKEVVRRLHV
jgi:hypothetical protein